MSSMALPPDILSAVQGGAPSAPAGGPPEPQQGGGGEESAIGLLQQMIDLGKQYLDVEPDEEDKATMTKVLAQLQSYLAKNQKEQDQMLGGSLSPRGLRKLGGSAA